VPAYQSFPTLLARRLEADSPFHVKVINLGVNGHTTADLIRDELPHADAAKPDIVTVLIGVNDYVQGISKADYRARLRQIYAALNTLGLPEGRIVAVSIPDFSYTPQGPSFGKPEDIQAGIKAFNDIAADEAPKAHLLYADIFDVSRSGMGQQGWVAGDGLHPARAQYQAWVGAIYGHVNFEWPGINPRNDGRIPSPTPPSPSPQ
jgi:lysophospholipase L1-like esterase